MQLPVQLMNLQEYFKDLPDPRKARGKRHELLEIVVISLLAMLCGADNAEEIQLYGDCNKEWLQTFLRLPHGVPTQDTYLRVFAALEPGAFQERFRGWVQSLVRPAAETHLAIDGKTIRHSYDKDSGSKAIHMVSAWLLGAGLVLGQVKTSEKSNEITAIPELLKLIDIKNAVITIDAMGCQRAIAKQIDEQGGSYVLAVKKNQPALYEDIVGFFEDADRLSRPLDEGPPPIVDSYHHTDAGHGRIEQRTCRVSEDLSWVQNAEEWAGLTGIARIEAVRENLSTGKVSTEFRYYILSTPEPSAQRLNSTIRNHWGIENSLHWVLDVTFGEDASRVRMGNAAENLSTIRKVALNLLKVRPEKKKMSIRRKRKRCAWEHGYLLETLAIIADS